MSNRRESARARLLRAYRNARLPKPQVTLDAQGRARRGEGRNNFPYDVKPGVSPSVLTLVQPEPEVPDYEAMTRDDLRRVAKEKGLSGYGHLNKAALVRAVSGA